MQISGFRSVQAGGLLLQPGGQLDQALLAEGEGGLRQDLAQGAAEGALPQLCIQRGAGGGLPVLVGEGWIKKRASPLLPYQVFPFSQNSMVGISMGLNIGVTPVVMFPPKGGSVPDVRPGLIGDGGRVGLAEADDGPAHQIVRGVVCTGGLPVIVLLQLPLCELSPVVPVGHLAAGAEVDRTP